jgi:hypothetical protein
VHVVHHIHELLSPSLACLRLLVPLLQLGLKVVNAVLGNSQLILGVLQLSSGAVECISLEVEVAIRTQ